ncbi:short-chain dehydrogenase [Fulvitalea axinellae]|uniref:Short-chain dehydrogenase n=1 Tax=Fulvitalea axinellae TaxID=1182444 RepID=A0AAU9DD00_9BACT|nr:short-chain dehydrogenase [Fulvitalea axinellae]
MSKTVIISGAAGGLGRAVVESFLKADYQVVALTQLGLPDQVKFLEERFKDNGKLEIVPMDVTREEEVGRNMEVWEKKYGHVDAVVSLVGGFMMGDLEATDEASIDKMVFLNFKTAFHLAKQGYSVMKRNKGGRIVLVSARGAFDINAAHGSVAYSISKGMVKHLAEIINESGRKHNVRCSTVVPNIIDTPLNRKAMPDADFDKWVKAEQIGEVIRFACDQENDFLAEPVYKVYGEY